MATMAPSRRQSKRQPVRTSTTRPTNYYARNFGVETPRAPQEREPGFFPAIQHFTDCAYALPKEMTSHISMLKEVEAKMYAPDKSLWELMDKISALPSAQRYQATGHTAAQSLAGSINGSVDNGNNSSPVTGNEFGREIQSSQPQPRVDALQREELTRRELCNQLTIAINYMNPVLDEKIAVLHTANESLRMQLERMQSSYKHMDDEISEEARLGSTTHWAYVERGEAKKPGPTAGRRDGVRALADAAEGDMAAARSEARREAMMAKKSRSQHIDSDFDDRPASKKPHGNKGRKHGGDAEKAVGLGIANGPGQPKKRKIAHAPEKTIAGALAQAKGNAGSPREMPVSDFAPVKRKKPGPAPGTKKKPPPLNSSPALQPPAPSSTAAASSRPNAARARQSSQAQNVAAMTDKARPASSASNRPPTGEGTPALKPTDSVTAAEEGTMAGALPPGTKALKQEEANTEDNVVTGTEEVANAAVTMTTRGARASKTATPVAATFPSDALTQRARTTRNGNGNGSGNGSEANGSTAGGKRGHKKNAASIALSVAAGGSGSNSRRGSLAVDAAVAEISEPPAAIANTATVPERASTRPQRNRRNPAAVRDEAIDMPASDDEAAEDEAAASGEEEDEEGEQTYCYCNDAGAGTMVGCDNDDCPRQWFHLGCVGLQEAPSESEKWYCPECTKEMGGKKQ